MYLATVCLTGNVQAGTHSVTQNSITGQATISISELPPEARDTLIAIKRGGPYEFARDGVVFKNFERLLPKHPRGYYREYTVRTPGTHGRGARRIITGEQGEFFYTADHYRSFLRIRE